MNNQINKILFYTRINEVLFHLEMAKQLKLIYPNVKIEFITFFTWAAKRVKEKGYVVYYMPDELQKVTGQEISDERFEEIDRQLYNGVGANYNLILHCERFLPTDREDAIRFGRKHLVVLDRIIKDGTLSISAMYDHFIYWLGGSLANIRNGWHFAFVVCGVPPRRVFVQRTPWETWKVQSEEDTQRLLNKCIMDMNLPVEERIDYMQPPSTKPKFYLHIRDRLNAIRDFNFDARHEEFYFSKKISFFQIIRNRLPRKWFLKKYLKSHDINSIDDLKSLKTPSCYYPLHLEPEATILTYSPWLRDQLEVCRLISQALPVNWKLIIKENPLMLGLRNLKYYKQLKRLPNVQLIDPTISSRNVILNSDITITLCGTASMEARILGKPSISLGRPPFLGMLNGGDISSGFQLAKLFEIFKSSDDSLDLETWNEWVASTFPGTAWYDYEGIHFIQKPDIGNASEYIKIINQVVQK